MKIAFLIIDVQEKFIGHKRGKKYDMTFEYINETAEIFRESNLPVYVIRDVEGGTGPEFDNVKELETKDSDIEILKEYSNSFWKTDLETKLKGQGVEFVVLCGNAAEFCVLATFNGAIERDFGVSILQNGVFAHSKVGLEDHFLNRSIISIDALYHFIKVENGE
jgi:nicotinamidase-related amidase